MGVKVERVWDVKKVPKFLLELRDRDIGVSLLQHTFKNYSNSRMIGCIITRCPVYTFQWLC